MTNKNKLDLFAISWPIFVEQLLMMAIGTLGLWMAGHVSTSSVAIYGLANQLRGIFDRLFRVVGIGTSVVVTQHKGGGDDTGAREVARAGLAASVWTGLIAMALIGLAPAQALKVLRLPPELFEQAIPFFVLIGFGLLLDSIFITMVSVLRAYTFTKDSMRLTMAMNILQVVVSFPLVFGFAGIPAQGLMGLGWGQVISRLLVIALLGLMWLRRLHIRLSPVDLFRLARGPLSGILHIGLPSAGEKIAFRIAFLMTVSMAAGMGTSALASHAYGMQAASWVTMYMVSLGFGSEIIIGHLIGAGKLKQANATLWRALWIAMGITVAGAVVSCFLTPAAIGWLANDPQLVSLITTIVLLELILEPGRCLNVVLMGGLRAAGDVRFPVKFSVVSNFVFGAGLAWVLGVHYGMGLPGIWIAYVADEWARGLIMGWRWYRLGWTTTARAARRRILKKLAAAC
ncbi:MAG: efflux family protein [Proteobacteria bacterium]|nr:efflux family protein [Pseudomonadota bacterium]